MLKKTLIVLVLIILYSCNKRKEITEYYSNGKVKEECEYIDGQKNWIVRNYYDNGQVQTEVFKKDSLAHGKELSYHPNGKLRSEGENKDGQRIGLFKFYYDNGILEAEEFYVNGLLDGTSKEYYQNGKIKTIYSFTGGKKDGLFKYFYETGKIKKIEGYKNGEGFSDKQYNEDGKVYYYATVDSGLLVYKGNWIPLDTALINKNKK
ncbi:MAG: toxin-antitoxin system YwqK family antitoxin [Bacteroidetes bacterium]|nr:toxin-antitoxin system YwqK family antitoxin [Bacteroidota bacterium]